MALQRGTAVSGFQVEALLGQGATASVYRAYQNSLQRYVALKVLAPQLTTDQGLVGRFQREGVHLARLQHEAIVAIYEAGSDGSHLFLAMQLIEGTSLKDRLAEEPVLEVPETLRILERVGAALDYAHGQGFIHRDVKPANILLGTDGRAYLADFGLIKALAQPGTTRTGDLVGTPLYMAPEQSAGQALTSRTDLYALACVAFECLTGTPPYTGDDVVVLLLAHAADRVPRASVRRPALPPAVDAIFEKALAKDPGDRYESVADFLTDLRVALTSQDDSLGSERRGPSRRTVLLGGLGSAALMAGGALWWVNAEPEHQSSQKLPVVTPVRQVSAGGYHNLALLDDATVKAWGDNSGGKLGDGTTTSQPSSPVAVSGLAGVSLIDAGVLHSMALMMKDGTVRAWGQNEFGQLGDGSATNRSAPFSVPGLEGVTSIASGGFWGTDGRTNEIKYAHSLALLSDGTVRAWGSNNDGQLGDGTTTNRNTPGNASGLEGVTGLAAGATHSLALLADGTVKVWGDNGLRGVTGTDNTKRAANTAPVTVLGLADVVAVAAGCFHSVALLRDGTVRTWGWNADGQLGDGSTTDRPTPVAVPDLVGVTAVAAGDRFSVALLESGEVRTWGANDVGQLGDGNIENTKNPVTVADLTGATSASASFLHCLALLADGTVRAWGDNAGGELGDGTTENRRTPFVVTGLAN
jgi:serine/threonine protein kinase